MLAMALRITTESSQIITRTPRAVRGAAGLRAAITEARMFFYEEKNQKTFASPQRQSTHRASKK
jgi:hypothetical protein